MSLLALHRSLTFVLEFAVLWVSRARTMTNDDARAQKTQARRRVRERLAVCMCLGRRRSGIVWCRSWLARGCWLGSVLLCCGWLCVVLGIVAVDLPLPSDTARPTTSRVKTSTLDCPRV